MNPMPRELIAKRIRGHLPATAQFDDPIWAGSIVDRVEPLIRACEALVAGKLIGIDREEGDRIMALRDAAIRALFTVEQE